MLAQKLLMSIRRKLPSEVADERERTERKERNDRNDKEDRDDRALRARSGNGNGNGAHRIQSSFASLGALATLLIQTGVAVWWAAGIASDVAYLKVNAARTETVITTIENTRFTAGEEKVYRQDVQERMLRLEERMRQMEMRR